MDVVSIIGGIGLGAIFGFIGLLLLANQANSSSKMLPAWITVPVASIFFGVSGFLLTISYGTAFGPEWVLNKVPDVFWYYSLGFNLPAGVYWYFASRNPNKSKFIDNFIAAV